MAANNRTRKARESVAFLGLVGGILLFANILGFFAFFRADATHDKLFSLSDGSIKLARGLKDQMEIRAYFTEDLPPPFNATERYVRDILSEYAAASNGKITVTYINPNDDDKRKAAEEDGVQKVSHQVIENDSAQVREGFRGLVFTYIGEKKTIPVVEDTAGLEYRITMLMKQLVGDRQTIGVLSGFGGPSLTKGLSGLRESTPTYEIKEIDGRSDLDPKELRALLIVAPENEIPEDVLRRLNSYVMRGGSIGVFGGTMKIDPEGQSMEATKVNTGLNALLEGWGLKLNEDIVHDARCGRAPMQTALGIPMYLPYPPVPIVTFDEAQNQHPATFNLDQVVMPFASSISVTAKLRNDRAVTTSVLGRSSEQSWVLSGDTVSLQQQQEWRIEGNDAGKFPLIVAVEGKLPSAFPAAEGDETPARSTANVHVLVSGASGFMRDEFLPRAGPDGQRDLTSALAFALNAIDWLAADVDLIAIRAKNVEDPALNIPSTVKEAEADARTAVEARDREKAEKALARRKEAMASWESTKDNYKWFNTLGIPLAVALFGVLRWQMRKAKKANMKL